MREVTPAHSRRRRLLPTALCLLGISLLIGCIPIPMKEKVTAGTDYRRVFGDHGQWLVDGQTTREQIVKHLGPPQHNASDGEFFGYFLETNTGYWIQPLCFQGVRADQLRILLLQFGKDGTLLRHQISEYGSGPYIFTLEKVDPRLIDGNFRLWSQRNWPFPASYPSPSTQP
jgi:hypothetical protein